MRGWLLALGVLLLTSCGGVGRNPTPVVPPPAATNTATSNFNATGAAKATRAWGEMLTETAEPTFSPPTITAIMAATATGRGVILATMRALPTYTPTPTITLDAHSCRASDLRAGEPWAQGATGNLFWSLSFTNGSKHLCTLEGPPNILLVDGNGQPLDAGYMHECSGCDGLLLMDATPPAATATAVAQSVMNARIGVRPSQEVFISLIQWGRWCQPAAQGLLRFRLVLGDGLGHVDVPTEDRAAGECDFPEAHPFASVTMSQFMYP